MKMRFAAFRTDQAAFAHALLKIVCLLVLCITLTLGLWPFHPPANQITWLRDANGISYGHSGTVLSSGNFPATSSGNDSGQSVEVWAQPHPYQKSATLLSFYAPPNPYRFRISQALTGLRLQDEFLDESDRPTSASFYVPETFRHAKPAFITIASGSHGTTVYTNGALAGRYPGLRIPASSFTGRLILGDTPLQPDSWSGQVLGLAIYGSELTGAQTQRHYRTWTTGGTPQVDPAEHIVALYLFDEHDGRVLHNKVKPGIDLYIPERYEVVDKTFMEPFWQEFKVSQGYWSALLKNIVGLIPLGFCFYQYFSTRRLKRAALLTVAFGTLVSITIEVLQWFLPTRESGTTDIFTNTLGTWVGVLLHQYLSPILVRQVPWLRFVVVEPG